MTEYNEQEVFEELALQEEHSLEDHEYIDPEVELVEDELGIKAILSLPGVAIKDVRNLLKRKGSYRRRTLSSIKKIVVHHSGTVTGSAEAYANYHTGTLGWPGVGYHIVIEQDGTVKLCNDLESISYHAGNANSYSVGVSLTGDFSRNQPTDAQWQKLYKVLASLLNYLPGVTSVESILAHQECPGYASKQCPSLDMDAMRYEVKAGTYRHVANKFKNDQKIAVINRSVGGPIKNNLVSSTGQIGVAEILVDSLNVRSAASFTAPIVKEGGKEKALKRGTKWKVYEQKNGLLRVGSGQWISGGSKYVKLTKF